MKSYFESIGNKDFDKVLTLFSQEQAEREKTLHVLHLLNQTLGDLQEYELASWEIRRIIWKVKREEEEEGTYFSLKYKVTYSKYSVLEIFTLFRPTSGGDPKIIKWDISSEAFSVRQ